MTLKRSIGIAAGALLGVSSAAYSGARTLEVQAAAPSAAASAAAKASPDLTAALSKELGATPEQSAGAAGALFGAAKTQMKPTDWALVAKAVPGMAALLKAAPAGGKKKNDPLSQLGASAGGLAGAAAAFSKLGLAPDSVAKAIPVLTSFVTKSGGADVGKLLAGALTLASAADMSGFAPIKTNFSSLPPAKSMGELAKAKQSQQPQEGEPAGPALTVGTPGQPVPAPSTQFHEIGGGKIFKASVPTNWTALAGKSSIKVVPEKGYGDMNGQTVFNYGVEFGISQAASRDLGEATKAFLNAIAQGNPGVKLGGQQQALKISQRSALATPLVNPSALGGNERVVMYTTFLADGTLFYYLTVVPEKDSAAFEETFRRIVESIRLTDAR